MSNQQSMSSPEHSSQQQQQNRLYNDDPREQYAQQSPQQSISDGGSYEEGYQGYRASLLEGEKLRLAPPPTLPIWKIVLIILIIALVVSGAGVLGSLISIILGFLGGSFGLIVGAFIVLAAISTRPVPLPTKTFTVAERAELSIHNDAGNVRIMRGKNHQVEVHGTRYISKLLGEGNEVPIFYIQDGNSINVNVKHWSFLRFFNIGYVNVDVYVPATSDVRIQCNAGTLDISGVSGRVNADTNAGTVAVASSHLADGSSLNTNAGTITVRQSTIDGTRSRTNAGTITITESVLQGNVAFSTDAGTIHFDGTLSPGSDCLFKTSVGTVDAILPPNSSFELTARTSMGTVSNDFHSNRVGPGPYAHLNLESQMGTVSVRKKGK
jgi:hypothetical protein